MKKLLLVLLLLVTAGSVFAAELKVTGDMMVRGNMDSLTPDGGDTVSASYFDYDLNIFGALVANENATVFTKLTYDKNVKGSGVVADSDNTSVLSVERAYLNYKFAPFAQLNTGLMGGGQWASSFGDTEINVMRVQAIGALSADMVFIATYEKQSEAGDMDIKDAEKSDKTVYYLASRMKFGPVTVLPLLTYATQGVNYDGALAALGITKTYDANVKAFTLGLNGDFGMIGFEAEGVYKKLDGDGFYDDNYAAILAADTTANNTIAAAEGQLALPANAPGTAGFATYSALLDYATEGAAKTGAALTAAEALKDSTTYGFYANLFAKVDPAKVGFAVAYGSSDAKDGSYSWGGDFDFTQVVDDIYSAQLSGTDGLSGYTAYKLYADVTVDKISGGIAGIYGAATDKDVQGDVSFWEVDLSAGYAFDANAAYAVNFGYASIEDGDASTTTTAWNLTHKFSVKF